MALILNIETSSTICSVALAKDGHLLEFIEDKERNSHAKVLTLLIDKVLAGQNLALKKLDAIAISAGPGSYTGLRIGTSVAKGLCYTLNKPLIAVPTLLSLAIQMAGEYSNALYMPALDARRGDIYTAIFDNTGNELEKVHMATLNEAFIENLHQYDKIVVGGNGLQKCREALQQPGNIVYAEGIDCTALNLVSLAEEKFKNQNFEDLAYFQPLYINEFPAAKKQAQ